MRPIANLDVAAARALSGLLFDLDDTLLDGTALGEPAYASLFRLRESGLALVAVTGRPSGWGEVIARQWPVLGVVVENGALAFSRVDGRLQRFDSITADERRERSRRLATVADEVVARHPELRLTDDMRARETDVTFDIGEHERVEEDVVREAERTAMTLGARTRRSSVHLHVTLEGHDKASGALAFLYQRAGIDPTVARSRFAFIGDSENDAACFTAFSTTIAVSNFRGRPTLLPRFVTEKARGAGFAEAAGHIVRLRR